MYVHGDALERNKLTGGQAQESHGLEQARKGGLDKGDGPQILQHYPSYCIELNDRIT